MQTETFLISFKISITLVGGSTEEAQSSIGIEVGSALVKFINTGSTLGAVNFPEVDIRYFLWLGICTFENLTNIGDTHPIELHLPTRLLFVF